MIAGQVKVETSPRFPGDELLGVCYHHRRSERGL